MRRATWMVLVGAIVAEVVATLALRAALDSPGWYALTAAGYVTAFVLLALLLRMGAKIGSVYGICAASGVALTALLAAWLFGEALTWPMVLGIVVVMVGVVLVETGHTDDKPAAPGSAAPGDATGPAGRRTEVGA